MCLEAGRRAFNFDRNRLPFWGKDVNPFHYNRKSGAEPGQDGKAGCHVCASPPPVRESGGSTAGTGAPLRKLCRGPTAACGAGGRISRAAAAARAGKVSAQEACHASAEGAMSWRMASRERKSIPLPAWYSRSRIRPQGRGDPEEAPWDGMQGRDAAGFPCREDPIPGEGSELIQRKRGMSGSPRRPEPLVPGKRVCRRPEVAGLWFSGR